MFKKKYFLMTLLFLIIAIGAISHASASDIDALDGIASDDASIGEVSSVEITENVLASADSTNEEIISMDSNSTAVEDDSSANDGSVAPQVKQVKVSAAKLTTIYKSKKQFKVKVLDSNGKAVSGLNVKIKVYTGSKSKTYSATTNSNGIAAIKVAALKVGKHKVLVNINSDTYSAGTLSSLIKINPRPVKISALTIKDKDSGGIYLRVKDKNLKKYVDGIPIKLLVYSGKKYKTYKLATSYLKDTKQHGAIMYLTTALSVGKHKVKAIAYGNYKATKISKIIIPKSAKKNPPIYTYSKKGKMVIYVKYKNQWIKA